MEFTLPTKVIPEEALGSYFTPLFFFFLKYFSKLILSLAKERWVSGCVRGGGFFSRCSAGLFCRRGQHPECSALGEGGWWEVAALAGELRYVKCSFQ